MKYFFLLACIILSSISKAQINFDKFYGQPTINYRFARCVQQSYDGGYIAVGSEYTGTYFQAILLRTNESGDLIWSKTYSSAIGSVDFDKILVTPDSDYIITGYINNDIIVIKADSAGNTLWQNCYSNNILHPMRAFSIRQTTDEGFIICGSTVIPNGNADDIFILKIDKLGNINWAKTIGGNGVESAFDVQQCIDGGYIVAGYTGVSTNWDALLMRLDSTGNILWSKTYDGGSLDLFKSVLQTDDGGFISVGSLSSEIAIVKTDSNGDTTWTKHESFENASQVIKTSNNKYVFTGSNFILETDSLGNLLWCSEFTYPFHSTLQQTNDSGFILTGGYEHEFELIKTDSNGQSECNVILNPVFSSGIYFIMGTPNFWVLDGGLITNNASTSVNWDTVVVQCTSSGIEPKEKSTFELFPNPTKKQFSVNCQQEAITQIEIFNLIGEKIYTSISDREVEQAIINCENFPKGIYFVKAFSNSGSGVKKIIIQ